MGLVGAVQFLTRIPIRTATAPPMAATVVWFPVVGALIGLVVGASTAGLTELAEPGVAAALGLVVGMLVTGAFHEDGLADLADAIAGGSTRERRLEILRDPRHGTYGVAALAGSVLVRWSALAALAAVSPRTVVVGAVAAHALGRGIAVGVMGLHRPASTPGLGADWMRDVGRPTAGVGLAIGAGGACLAAGRWAPVVVLAAATTSVAVVVTARRALGGVSGDVLGAVEQVAEATTLVCLVAVLT